MLAQPTLSQPYLDDVNLDKNNDSVSFIILDQFFPPSVHFCEAAGIKYERCYKQQHTNPCLLKRSNQCTS